MRDGTRVLHSGRRERRHAAHASFRWRESDGALQLVGTISADKRVITARDRLPTPYTSTIHSNPSSKSLFLFIYSVSTYIFTCVYLFIHVFCF